MNWFIRLLLIPLLLCGCAANPFPEERTEYTVAFVIDRSSSYQDDLAETAFKHFAKAKESLFRDAMGTECIVLLSQINGGQESVLFDGSPRAFIHRFPTKEKFQEFLNATPAGSSPVYLSCAETIERMCRRHAACPGMKSILLIYSDMEDNHGGQERLDAAAQEYAKYPCAVGLYRVNSEAWSTYFKNCGIKHCVAYDSKREDPPLPSLP
jgi:hypothetical protein